VGLRKAAKEGVRTSRFGTGADEVERSTSKPLYSPSGSSLITDLLITDYFRATSHRQPPLPAPQNPPQNRFLQGSEFRTGAIPGAIERNYSFEGNPTAFHEKNSIRQGNGFFNVMRH
jgi:hypothetical protein